MTRQPLCCLLLPLGGAWKNWFSCCSCLFGVNLIFPWGLEAWLILVDGVVKSFRNILPGEQDKPLPVLWVKALSTTQRRWGRLMWTRIHKECGNAQEQKATVLHLREPPQLLTFSLEKDSPGQFSISPWPSEDNLGYVSCGCHYPASVGRDLRLTLVLHL